MLDNCGVRWYYRINDERARLIEFGGDMDKDKLVEFEGYFRSQEFVANALGLRKELAKLETCKHGTLLNYTCAECEANPELELKGWQKKLSRADVCPCHGMTNCQLWEN
jgi:hypothetical protein